MFIKYIKSIIVGFFIPVLIFILWELSLSFNSSSYDSIAPPSAILSSFFSSILDFSLFILTFQTLYCVIVGLCIGGLSGLIFGMLIGLIPTLSKLTVVPIEILRTLPSVSLIPLFLIAFGFGYSIEVSIISFSTFWPMLILSQSAITNVDRQLVDVSRMLHLNFLKRIYKVYLPSITRRLIVALRLSMGIALIVAVTVEIVVNPQGLGYGLVISQQSLNPAKMLAYLLWLGIIGWILNLALSKIEYIFSYYE